MWDEAMVFISNTTFGNGIEAPQMLNAELVDQIKILDDQLNHFIRKNANG